MKCEGARELFSDYNENSMDYALMTALRAHMDDCTSCRHDYELFRRTWEAMDALPDIAPQVDFRHDVVMQAARIQHEKSQAEKRPFWSLGAHSIFTRTAYTRLAAAAVSIMIAFMLMFYGNVAVDVFKSWIIPVYQIVPEEGQASEERSSTETATALDAGMKSLWQSRQLGRNSLWVTVEPKHNNDGRIVYKVLLSINEASFRKGDISLRIGAEVFLLSPDANGNPKHEMGESLGKWNVLANEPLLVPVVVDRSQGRTEPTNLLITWNFRDRKFAQIIYLPSEHRGSYSGDIYATTWSGSSVEGSNNDLYGRLQEISRNYGVVIVANALMEVEPPAPVVGDGNLEWILRSTLKPVELDWMIADHAVYVDKPYHFMKSE